MKLILSIGLLCTWIIPTMSQTDKVPIDLAVFYNTSLTSPIPRNLNSIKAIVLSNAFPKRAYLIKIDAIEVLHPPLDKNDFAMMSTDGTKCPELEMLIKETSDWINKVTESNTEIELGKKLSDLKAKAAAINCTNQAILDNIKKLEEQCEREIPLPFELEIIASNNYIITVTSGTKIWTYTMQGKSHGQWVVSYGFLFSSRALEPQQYFLRQSADTFVITKRATPNVLDLRFAPTIFFNYFLNNRRDHPWNGSFSAGIGVNSASPVVSLGFNLMYRHNVGFSTGVVFYEQQKLDGSYHEGQGLKENIEESKLYEKGFFRPNLFLAINLRLGQDPFKKAN
ncbi:hypothetical protein ACX0G7_10490 [Flavitalea antarctica]